MNRKYRISSPQVFETILTKSELFRKHDWLFDIHPGIVSGFQPDVRVTFNSDPALTNTHFGHVATIERQLIAHPNFALSGDGWSLSVLEAETYVTMTHDDDAFLSIAAADGSEAQLRPSRVFRGNDIRAAELAVKLNVGYSALPKFLLDAPTADSETHIPLLSHGQVSPTYLRIESAGPPDIQLSEIHEALLSSLTPVVNTSWRPFGQTQNIVPMVCSK